MKVRKFYLRLHRRRIKRNRTNSGAVFIPIIFRETSQNARRFRGFNRRVSLFRARNARVFRVDKMERATYVRLLLVTCEKFIVASVYPRRNKPARAWKFTDQ